MKSEHHEQELKKRFEQSVQEEIPAYEINRFRDTFETAWQQRSWFQRMVSKPLLSSILFLFAIVGAGSSLYLYWQTNMWNETSAFPQPHLMPGQRFSSNTELLSNFPPVQHASLIVTSHDHENSTDTFIAHGYLMDGDVQLVWEY